MRTLTRMIILAIICGIAGAVVFGFLEMPHGALLGAVGIFGGLIGGGLLGLVLGLVPLEVWGAVGALMEGLAAIGDCCSIFGVFFLGFAALIGTLIFSHNFLLSALVSIGTMAALIGVLAVGIWVDRMSHPVGVAGRCKW